MSRRCIGAFVHVLYVLLAIYGFTVESASKSKS
jgi:hypothetical protein